jgi:hypothetical protein
MKNKCLSIFCFALSGCAFINNEPPNCDSDDVREIIKKAIAKKTQYHFSSSVVCVNTKKYPEDTEMKLLPIVQIPSSEKKVNCGEYIPDFLRIKSNYENQLSGLYQAMELENNEAQDLEYRYKNNLPIIHVLGEGYGSDYEKVMGAKNTAAETKKYIDSIMHKYKIHLTSVANWVLVSDIKSSIDYLNVFYERKSENLKGSSFENTFRGSGYRVCEFDVGIKSNSKSIDIEWRDSFNLKVTIYGKDSKGEYIYQVTDISLKS